MIGMSNDGNSRVKEREREAIKFSEFTMMVGDEGKAEVRISNVCCACLQVKDEYSLNMCVFCLSGESFHMTHLSSCHTSHTCM
jgi:hypothetical protein